MYKLLFSILFFVTYIEIGYCQDITGTGWKFYEEHGGTFIMLFEQDGTFGHMRVNKAFNFLVHNEDNDTWKLEGNKIVILFNDGYSILSGTINKERDYMSGTSINKDGFVEEWYGTLIKH